MGYVDIHIIYIFCRYTLSKFQTLAKSMNLKINYFFIIRTIITHYLYL